MTPDYAPYARRLRASGFIPDPWYDGTPRFRPEPLVLDPTTVGTVARVGMRMARVIEAATQVVADRPELLEDFLRLTPVQQLMWRASQPRWHGMARADVFETSDGRWVACELNSDTPTGQPEAVVANALAKEDHPHLTDPNVTLPAAWIAMVRDALRFELETVPDTPVAGLVYPTEMTEDIHMVELLHTWLDRAGFQVVLGSPFQLGPRADGGVELMGRPIDVLVRHYKTDWWSERIPAWDDDEPIADAAALVEPLDWVLSAQERRRCAVVNPFGAVLSQNKRLMALLWERSDLFDPEIRALTQAHIPETVRLEAVHPEQLIAQRADWVLKSDYGCEGEEVFVGRNTTPEVWAAALEHAIPERWVAQRAFMPRVHDDGFSRNIGPFVVAGRTAGLYGRLQRGSTDHDSLSVAVLIDGTLSPEQPDGRR